MREIVSFVMCFFFLCPSLCAALWAPFFRHRGRPLTVSCRHPSSLPRQRLCAPRLHFFAFLPTPWDLRTSSGTVRIAVLLSVAVLWPSHRTAGSRCVWLLPSKPSKTRSKQHQKLGPGATQQQQRQQDSRAKIYLSTFHTDVVLLLFNMCIANHCFPPNRFTSRPANAYVYPDPPAATNVFCSFGGSHLSKARTKITNMFLCRVTKLVLLSGTQDPSALETTPRTVQARAMQLVHIVSAPEIV